jgi:hypothetical protein
LLDQVDVGGHVGRGSAGRSIGRIAIIARGFGRVVGRESRVSTAGALVAGVFLILSVGTNQVVAVFIEGRTLNRDEVNAFVALLPEAGPDDQDDLALAIGEDVVGKARKDVGGIDAEAR